MQTRNADDLRNGDWANTITGRKVHFPKTNKEDIHIFDIAHALSNVCRFAGHTYFPYPVSQHCIALSELVDPKDSRNALLHDSPEYLLNDMVRPVKWMLDDYRRAEENLTNVIYSKYGLFPDSDELKVMDARITLDEKYQVLGPTAEWDYEKTLKPLGITIHEADARVLRRGFVWRFHDLFPEHEEEAQEALKLCDMFDLPRVDAMKMVGEGGVLL